MIVLSNDLTLKTMQNKKKNKQKEKELYLKIS